jgi:two-component system chemotaxis response regulator CheV
MKRKTSKYDVYYDELISLISGDMNISSQYVVFLTCANEYYAINVAKVEELIQNKNIDIVKSTDSDILTIGVTKIREHLCVLLKFDDWIGSPIADDDELSLIILCKYSTSRLGLLVKDVIGIQRIELDALFNGTQRDEKIAYAVEITVNGKKELCNVFDFDQLTMDIYPNIITMNENLVHEMQIQTDIITQKYILIAEDSVLIQKQIRSLLDKMNLHYQLFDNGETLYNYLQNNDPQTVSLVVTDIEMPVMDGMELIRELSNNSKFDEIPIIAHTNMSNSAIAANILELGVLDIVDKLDLSNLKDSIMKYCR